MRSGGCGQGRALLMARGMTAWMQAWLHLAPLRHRPARLVSDTTSSSIERGMSESVVPESAQPELVRVLAAMAWAVGRG